MSKQIKKGNSREYVEGYPKIFNRCPKHKYYNAIRRPRNNCTICWSMYRNNQIFETATIKDVIIELRGEGKEPCN